MEMKEFKRKPLIVKAQQWFNGQEFPGLKEFKPEVIWSLDQKYFYLRVGSQMATQWLELAKRPGPVPQKDRDRTFDGYVEIELNGTGQVYHRHVMPFAFYSVKHLHQTTQFEISDLFDLSKTSEFLEAARDFVNAEGWGKEKIVGANRAYLHADVGIDLEVCSGDWIVRDEGKISVCSPEEFAAKFDAIQ